MGLVTLPPSVAEYISGLAERLANVERLLNVPPEWIPPTLENSWVNIGGAPGNEPAGYLRDALGFVHLRGRIKGGATGTAAFTIPAGYRPGASNGLYACAAFNGTAPTSAFVDLSTAGIVAVFFAAGTTEVGLGGVTWLAEG